MATSKSACTDADTAPGGRLHFLNLPAELQTMIFESAYYVAPNSRILNFAFLRSVQRDHRQFSSSEAPEWALSLPPTKVAEFLVSKSLFVAAARAYARDFVVPFYPALRCPPDNSVLVLFATKAGAQSLQMLGHIEARMPGSQFARLEVFRHWLSGGRFGVELPVLRERLTAADFEGLYLKSMTDGVRGLKGIELVPEDLPTKATEENKENWKAKIRVLEELVRAEVTQPKGRETPRNARGPLYAGSAVRFVAKDVQAHSGRAVPLASDRAGAQDEDNKPHFNLDQATDILATAAKVDLDHAKLAVKYLLKATGQRSQHPTEAERLREEKRAVQQQLSAVKARLRHADGVEVVLETLRKENSAQKQELAAVKVGADAVKTELAAARDQIVQPEVAVLEKEAALARVADLRHELGATRVRLTDLEASRTYGSNCAHASLTEANRRRAERTALTKLVVAVAGCWVLCVIGPFVLAYFWPLEWAIRE